MAFELDSLMPIAMQAGAIIVIVVVGALLTGAAILLTIVWKKRQIYDQYDVMIWERFRDKKGNEIPTICGFDKGGVIKDKKLDKWVFHLKKTNLDMGEEELKNFDENRDLDIPSIPGAKGKRVVFIEKLGNRKYGFGKVEIEGSPKIIVSEADLAEAKRSYELFVKSFSKKTNPMWAMMFYFGIAALTLVMIIVILQKFELIVEAAEYFQQGSQAMATKGAAVASNAPG